MIYRKLELEELQAFEKEFVDFLASNTITATDWEKLKLESLEKADGLIEIFSDTILQSVYERTTHMSIYGEDYAVFFQFDDEKAIAYVVKYTGELKDELTDDVIMMSFVTDDKLLEINEMKKKHEKTRELHVHEMFERGALVSDGVMFDLFHVK